MNTTNKLTPETVIEKALRIALSAHKGQTDKSGESYILHPLRLMAKAKTKTEKIVAVLHDVLEDSSYTPSNLYAEGIPDTIIDIVKILTRLEDEKYSTYINRIKKNDIASTIKMLDIEDNLNVLRLKSITKPDLSRIKKYHKAWSVLNMNEYSFQPSKYSSMGQIYVHPTHGGSL